MERRVAVLGAGAMGSLFGSRFAEGGLHVTLINIWREHVDAINDGGLRIVGHRGEHRVSVAATTDPAACGTVDVVLVQCKAASTTAAVRNALDAGLFRDDAVAISFQNGLGNEETIAGVLGAGRVLGGVTAQGPSIEGPGCIRSYADLPSQIGEMEGGLSERATAIARAFSRTAPRCSPGSPTCSCCGPATPPARRWTCVRRESTPTATIRTTPVWVGTTTTTSSPRRCTASAGSPRPRRSTGWAIYACLRNSRRA